MTKSTKASEWTIERLRPLATTRFGRRPCKLQLEVALAVYQGFDVVVAAATGFGKTLTFWMPLLMAEEDGNQHGIVMAITPLNILGAQNVQALLDWKISAVALCAETVSKEVVEEILKGTYNVIIINPELVLKNEHIQKLWDNRQFLSRIISVVFDEGHCVSQWKEFREDYEHIGELRTRIFQSVHVPFYVASATLPAEVLEDIKYTLHLRQDAKYFLRSCDRADIHLHARPLVYPAGSYQDLDFLIPPDSGPDNPPAKFVVFIDDTKKCEEAAAYLQSRLGNSDTVQNRIAYFHAILSSTQRELVVANLEAGLIWGLTASEAFGMGIDARDLRLAVQYLATCNVARMCQRYGRLVRGVEAKGVGILLYDKRDTVEWREQSEARRLKKRNAELMKKVTKRKAELDVDSDRLQKIPRSSGSCTDPLSLQVLSQTSQGGADELMDVDGDIDSPSDMDLDEEADEQCGENRNMEDRTQQNSELPVESKEWKEEEARLTYHQAQVHKPNVRSSFPQKRKRVVEVGSPMDDFINAKKKFGCRRTVLTIYFNNDKRGANCDHMACNPDLPDGCPRCAPHSPTVCCDLCDPSAFTPYAVTFKKPLRAPARSAIRNFKATEMTEALTIALQDWRFVSAVEKYGRVTVKKNGSQFFLSDTTIERLVVCAQPHKLTTPDSILKETNFRQDLISEFAQGLLEVIHKHFPLPVPEPDDDDVEKGTRVYRCRACGLLGHTKRSKKCSMYSSSKAQDTTTPSSETILVQIDSPPRAVDVTTSLPQSNNSPSVCQAPSVATSSGLPSFYLQLRDPAYLAAYSSQPYHYY